MLLGRRRLDCRRRLRLGRRFGEEGSRTVSLDHCGSLGLRRSGRGLCRSGFGLCSSGFSLRSRRCLVEGCRFGGGRRFRSLGECCLTRCQLRLPIFPTRVRRGRRRLRGTRCSLRSGKLCLEHRYRCVLLHGGRRLRGTRCSLRGGKLCLELRDRCLLLHGGRRLRGTRCSLRGGKLCLELRDRCLLLYGNRRRCGRRRGRRRLRGTRCSRRGGKLCLELNDRCVLLSARRRLRATCCSLSSGKLCLELGDRRLLLCANTRLRSARPCLRRTGLRPRLVNGRLQLGRLRLCLSPLDSEGRLGSLHTTLGVLERALQRVQLRRGAVELLLQRLNLTYGLRLHCLQLLAHGGQLVRIGLGPSGSG